MSRIGKRPIFVPNGVEVIIEENVVLVKSQKGSLRRAFNQELIDVVLKENQIVVSRKNESRNAQALHGLYRNLIANQVYGVTEGFSKKLEIKGVGYRAALKDRILELHLGFSHPIHFSIPEGIEIEFEPKSQNIFSVKGIDKELVGQVAANIREKRKPEPYKGKGVRYINEVVKLKSIKSKK